MERTFIVVKPDAVRNRHIGDILARFEAAEFSVIAMRMIRFDDSMVTKLYGQYAKESFYERNRLFIMSGPAVIVILEGKNVVAKVRELVGTLSTPGTLRGDYGTVNPENAVHASDSAEAAEDELYRFSAYFHACPYTGDQT